MGVDEKNRVLSRQRATYGQQQVFRLDVAVSDVLPVNVPNGAEKVSGKLPGLLLVVARFLDDALQQVPAGNLVQDHASVPRVVEDVVEAENVPVVHLPHELDLAL